MMLRGIHLSAVVAAVLALFLISQYLQPRQGPSTRDAAGLQIADLSVYYDPQGAAHPDSIADRVFAPISRHSAHGYQPGRLWFRFDLESAPGAAWERAILRIGVPNLDEVTLFHRDRADAWMQQRSGDLLPLSERPLVSPSLGFVIEQDKLGDNEFYLSVHSSGTLGVSMSVGEYSTMMALEQRDNTLLAAYIFLLFGATALTGVLYLQRRDRIFLIFFFSQLVYFCATVSYSGYLSVLRPDLATDRVTSIWVPLGVMATVFFHVVFFRALGAHKTVLIICQIVFVAYVLLIPAAFFTDPRILLQTSHSLLSFFLLLMAIAAWTIRNERYVSKRLLRIVYSIYLASIAIWVMPTVGLLPAVGLSFYGPAIQGIVNVTLIFAMVLHHSESERKISETAQQSLQKLRIEGEVQRRTSKLYRDLFWTVSHEVGTGLTIIRLALSKPRIIPKDRARLLRAIDGLEQLLENFNQCAHIEQRMIELNPQESDLAQLIADVAEAEGQKGGPPRFQIDQPQTLPITIDEVYARIVLSNLLSNAIKYSPEGSPVDIRVTIEIDRVVVVIDNEAVPEALPDPELVFDRFYRNAQVLAKPGTGLGLYIVQQLLQLLGGGCKLEVRDADRVRVSIWLPTNG
jgi:two-component system, sensor histidine kinase LadS